jgi:hypothetical protein
VDRDSERGRDVVVDNAARVAREALVHLMRPVKPGLQPDGATTIVAGEGE